jgi:hypothetical protein
MDQESLTNIVRDVLHGAPAWVRADLSSSDAMLRERAEDVLAGMIAARLAKLLPSGAGKSLPGKTSDPGAPEG